MELGSIFRSSHKSATHESNATTGAHAWRVDTEAALGESTDRIVSPDEAHIPDDNKVSS